MIDRQYHRYEDGGATLRVLIVRFERCFNVWSWMSDRALLSREPLFESWFNALLTPARSTDMPIFLKDEGPDFSKEYLFLYK